LRWESAARWAKNRIRYIDHAVKHETALVITGYTALQRWKFDWLEIPNLLTFSADDFVNVPIANSGKTMGTRPEKRPTRYSCPAAVARIKKMMDAVDGGQCYANIEFVHGLR
jgi:hypothetical protein